MEWLHLILNLAALLLWIHWRAGTMPRPKPVNSVIGPTPNLGPVFRHSWFFLVALLVLLGLRAVFYNQFGPGLDWVPSLNLIDQSPHFRSDYFPRALAFSVLSFARWLVALYFCLALLSAVRPDGKRATNWREFLKAQFGWLGNWSPVVHWIAALALAVGVHLGETHWMESLGVLTQSADPLRQIPTLIVLDLSAAVYLMMLLLALYLLNSYVYFGEQNFWKNVDDSGRRLLKLFRAVPLVVRKIDLAPFIAFSLAYGLSFVLRHDHLASWLGAIS
jgi:uncharacterized protein YggT (Ycf19 family)